MVYKFLKLLGATLYRHGVCRRGLELLIRGYELSQNDPEPAVHCPIPIVVSLACNFPQASTHARIYTARCLGGCVFFRLRRVASFVMQQMIELAEPVLNWLNVWFAASKHNVWENLDVSVNGMEADISSCALEATRKGPRGSELIVLLWALLSRENSTAEPVAR